MESVLKIFVEAVSLSLSVNRGSMRPKKAIYPMSPAKPFDKTSLFEQTMIESPGKLSDRSRYTNLLLGRIGEYFVAFGQETAYRPRAAEGEMHALFTSRAACSMARSRGQSPNFFRYRNEDWNSRVEFNLHVCLADSAV